MRKLGPRCKWIALWQDDRSTANQIFGLWTRYTIIGGGSHYAIMY